MKHIFKDIYNEMKIKLNLKECSQKYLVLEKFVEHYKNQIYILGKLIMLENFEMYIQCKQTFNKIVKWIKLRNSIF